MFLIENAMLTNHNFLNTIHAGRQAYYACLHMQLMACANYKIMLLYII